MVNLEINAFLSVEQRLLASLHCQPEYIWNELQSRNVGYTGDLDLETGRKHIFDLDLEAERQHTFALDLGVG
jgi:hypothetical protein